MEEHPMKKLSLAVVLPMHLILLMLILTLMLAVTNARAQTVDRFGETRVVVPLFKSAVLDLPAPAARVSIGNPDIADILILRANQLYVLGKDLGTTNVILWDSADRLVGNVSVEVQHDLENLKEKLHVLLPEEPIEVFSAQRSIVLRGTVSSPVAMQTALDLAWGYVAKTQSSAEAVMFEEESGRGGDERERGKIINMLQVGGAQQVMLEVKVAEIARTELKRLNAQFNGIHVGDDKWNFGGVNGGARFPDVEFGPPINGRLPVFNNLAPYGPVVDEFAPNPLAIQNQGLFASFLTSNTLFNLAIDAAREKGLARILAEPTLTTLSGEQAEFLSGGEFPIPVPRGDRGITIEFREFGVGLKFLPVVLGSGNINVKLNISVSELVNPNTIGIQTAESTASFLIPALSTRSASSVIELREGQTLAIAGLINENLRTVVTKFPGLGEIPVLGALFRSQEFINNESELVIVVTPHLARPMQPGRVRLPTDNYVQPSDVDFYLFGRTEGRRARPAPIPVQSSATGSGSDADIARYGHQVQ
jgi:pilus assembly protein CpaC